MIINDKEIPRLLIISQPWIDLILNGEKTWEMRSKETKIQGWIGLVEKGTKTIVGIAKLDSSFFIYDVQNHFSEHRINYTGPNDKLLKYKWAWVLNTATRIEPPYIHPRGALIWVRC